MSTSHRFLSCALLLSLALTGCGAVFTGRGPHRDTRGGFTVVVDGPGRPAGKAVAADIGAFAQNHGYARQPYKAAPAVDPVTHEAVPPAPERYLGPEVVVEVTYLPAEHRVSAYLHGPETSRNEKAIERFFRDFKRDFAGRYGGESHISETAYAPTPIE